MQMNTIVWPCELSANFKNTLMRSARICILDKDHQIVIGDGGMNGLFYALEGLVVLGIEESTNTSPLCLLKPQQWFGATLIYKKPDFRYQFFSFDYAKLLFIPEEIVQNMANQHPEIYKFLYFSSLHRLTENIDFLWITAGMPVSQRVAYLLLKVSECFPTVTGARPMIPLSQTVLSKALGISRLSLSQALQRLKEKKIISIERKSIYIVNTPAVETLARGSTPPPSDCKKAAVSRLN